MRLLSAATATFGFHERIFPRLTRRRMRPVQITPHQSRIIIIRIWVRCQRRLHMSTSIRCCCHLVVVGHVTHPYHRRYSTFHCRVENCASQRSRRSDRCRCARGASIARNCSLCRRIGVGHAQTHRTTAQRALSMRHACVPRELCSITARRTTMATMGRCAVPGNRRHRPAPGFRRRSVAAVASGRCLHCCPSCCHASGATPHWLLVTGARCAAATAVPVTAPRRPLSLAHATFTDRSDHSGDHWNQNLENMKKPELEIPHGKGNDLMKSHRNVWVLQIHIHWTFILCSDWCFILLKPLTWQPIFINLVYLISAADDWKSPGNLGSGHHVLTYSTIKCSQACWAHRLIANNEP